MKKLSSNQLFVVSLVGMVGTIVLIALGHNTFLTQLFAGLNTLGIGGGVVSSIKGVKRGG